jgi:hypothetical protein
MAEQEQPTPEEVNVYNRALIHDLRLLYTPADETQSIDRVRDRLRAIPPHRIAQQMDAPEKSPLQMQQKLLQQVHHIAIPSSHKGSIASYLGTIAAIIVLAIIVGSLLLIAHGSQKHIASLPPAQTSLSTATSSFGNGWKVVASYTGTGSKTITTQHLVFNHVLGVWITCTGKGTTDIVFNDSHGKKYHSSCHNEAKNRLSSVLQASTSYAVEGLDITVDKNSSWQLQLVSCLNITATSACGIPYVARSSPPTA